MMKTFTTISGVLLTVICLSLAHLAEATTDKYRVMWRTDPARSMVIGWNQASGSNPVVYYGTADEGTTYSAYPNSATPDRVVSYKGMNNHFVRLTGLQPNTAYYFVIRDSQGTSRRLWFKTAPDSPTERLSFIAGGDSRNNRTPRINANKLVAKLRPHAVLFGGDMTDNGYDSQWQGWFDDWQYSIGSDGRIIPFVATRGNHESSNTMLVNLFDVPNSNVYYALTFGGGLVRSYTLNTEISTGGDQTTWLANDLAANGNVTWKMAQYHKPMRPHVSGKSEGNGQYSNWAGLFYQHKVKLVVECDAHTVKTTWPVRPYTGSGSDEGFIRDDANGTVYAGEGCWGAPLRTNDDNKAWTRNSGRFNQFKWIFVDEDKIELRTIRVDNADQVGTVSDNNIFATPANLDIWNPSNGAVVTILNEGTTAPPTGDSDAGTVSVRVSSSMDDVEEAASGTIYTNSSDLELVYDSHQSAGNQTVGMRFTGVNVPSGATVTRAYLQFTTDESTTGSTSLTIRGEDVNNSSAFSTSSYNVSSRSKTSASVAWSPAGWSSVGESGSAQRTPELKSIIQEIVNRSGWSSGNAMSLMITGSGKRTAESYDGSASSAPLLYIEYTQDETVATNGTVDVRIASGNDDVEENQNGGMYMNSSDIELVYDGSTRGNQSVGLRFTGHNIPAGATITRAYIRFTTDESTSGGSSLTIHGEDRGSAAAFTTSSYNVSSRTKTSASVSWSPSAWSSVGASSSTQQTPELKQIVQEIVNRDDYNASGAMAFMVTGSGRRTAEAYDGSSSRAALLHVEYTVAGQRLAEPVVDLPVSIAELSLDKGELMAFPNPFDESLTIDLQGSGIEGQGTLYLISVNGHRVAATPYAAREGMISIKTSHLQNGIYFVRIEQENGRVVQGRYVKR
ncbi:fibronectin type III domain-containing protein [Roseivirga sp. BDSF3-8]|uniref:fibronectin type III domain-containing protein n=1 Tax=Roseivirga sp. BDSF3-8 TaxID=3241598 RepID=UPI00353222A0